MTQLAEAPPKRGGRPPKAKPVEVAEVVTNSDDCPVVQIIEREYYLKETGEPLKLEPHQRRIINAAFALDQRGKQKYRTLIYSAPKKCVNPDARVLTADLRWVAAGTLRVGDKLLAFDEHSYVQRKGGTRRRFRISEVIDTGIYPMKARRIFFSDNTFIDSSLDHRWFTKVNGGANLKWKETSKLKVGDKLSKYLHPWEDPTSYDDGYMAGALDGEANVRQGAWELGISQKENALWENVVRILEKDGIPFSVTTQRGNYKYKNKDKDYSLQRASIYGRAWVLYALGHYRPKRLLAQITEKLDGEIGQIWRCDDVEIVDIVDLDAAPLVSLTTSTATYFAEGFAAHNSGKTEIGSALTYAFLRLYGGQCYSIANDQEQASSRMFQRVVETLELMREKNPHLYLKVIHPDYAEKIFKGRTIRFSPVDQINPGPHELAYIPNDFRGEAGGMPALTMWDELWGYSSSSSERLWTEMQPVPTLPVSMRIVTTYAGFYGESHLLYSIYESLVDPDPHTEEPRGKRVEGLGDLPCFEKGSYFCYWDHEARMPWHTPEFMDEAHSDPSLNGREQEYERIWRNRWVTGLDAFIPMQVINERMAEGEELELVNNMAA